MNSDWIIPMPNIVPFRDLTDSPIQDKSQFLKMGKKYCQKNQCKVLFLKSGKAKI